nr:MAG TPA: hypothetical protein [Caudoviricetes sp.]
MNTIKHHHDKNQTLLSYYRLKYFLNLTFYFLLHKNNLTRKKLISLVKLIKSNIPIIIEQLKL